LRQIPSGWSRKGSPVPSRTGRDCFNFFFTRFLIPDGTATNSCRLIQKKIALYHPVRDGIASPSCFYPNITLTDSARFPAGWSRKDSSVTVPYGTDCFSFLFLHELYPWRDSARFLPMRLRLKQMKLLVPSGTSCG
jgi:hypothetical protein